MQFMEARIAGASAAPPVALTARPATLLMIVAALAIPHLARPAAAGEEAENLPAWIDLAGPPDPADRVIQKRKYELNSELTLLLGALPSSPFYKAATLTLGYTVHFNNYLAWEIGSLTYAQDFDTDLKQQLLRIINNSNVPVPELPQIIGYGASHLVIKPFYGKQALMDAALVHLEGFLQAGPAALFVQRQITEHALALGLDWGIGIRLWITPLLSARLELGEIIYFVGGGVWQALHTRAGLALNFGGEE